MSLTLAELVERTGDPPHLLRFVLAQEIAVGRVVWTADGGYALVASSFPPAVLAGLRWLSGARPSDVLAASSGRGSVTDPDRRRRRREANLWVSPTPLLRAARNEEN